MLYKSQRTKKFSKCKKIVAFLLAFIIIIVVVCEYQISSFKCDYIRTQAEILSSNSINDVVNKYLNKNKFKYSDLAKITYSKDEKVKSIETNSLLINKIKADITKNVQNQIEKMHENKISIPIGSLTNISAFSNVGPPIYVKFNLTGSFSSKIVSTFNGAGVNQTLHHIRLIVTSKIMTTSLNYSGKITYTTDFEIAQSVIIGDIPNYYGNICKSY